jgi:hypothetical protein
VAVSADHHLGVAAAFEIFADGPGQFVADPGAESVSDIDVLA